MLKVDVWVLKLNIPAVRFGEFFQKVILRAGAALTMPMLISYGICMILPWDIPLLRLILISLIYWLILLPMVWFIGMDNEVRNYVWGQLRDRFGDKILSRL